MDWNKTAAKCCIGLPFMLLLPMASLHAGEQISPQPSTALDQRLEREERWKKNRLFIIPHRPNYLMPIAYNTNPNSDPFVEAGEGDIDKLEAKFQISFKIPLWENIYHDNAHLYAAYTQVSYWQVYNAEFSSPFRETNYEPEVFLIFDTDKKVGPLRNRLFALGAVHQSNGREDPISRSWNRLYALFVLDRDNFFISLKPWWRFPEGEKDDNPNMGKYYGYGELRGSIKLQKNVFSLLFRNNLRSDNKGAIELSYSYPIAKTIFLYLQFFDGYGESLIDYDHHNTRFSAGFALNDWL